MTDAWTPPVTAPAAASTATVKQSYDPAAITALGLAVTSVFIWFIPAVVAIFLASGAKRNIKAQPDLRKGKGMATAAQLISVAAILFAAAITALLTLIP